MALKRGVIIAFMVSLMAIFGACSGAVYRVGDTAGWIATGAVDYNKWASTKTFHVGDTIVFDYNTQFHNVKQVRHQDFQTCNVTSPMATYSSGSDSITLKRSSHLYFTCGFPGHCQAGQKVDIRVLPASIALTGSPTSSPSPSPNDLAFGFGLPSITTPSSPAQNSAARPAISTLFYSSLGSLLLVALGLWMAGFEQ
ncbi:hypothetical protein HS088_TW22G00754 [Tripterygium wilfordii]|uniref:Phytocyanin domain-containing protein n=1 Tax=Tripterygium wilfordii TaxID=458696 RepID=A0A7J7BZM1_TRIWF|nr:mavicyanin-like [Tripterygium wilfordii]KAF5727067.1 hypothetical protein HS088_TW22G00754 [Tripterygium wilfordii]